MTTTRSTLCLAAVLLASLVSGTANAQATPVLAPTPATAPSCVQSIPQESMTRVPVFAVLTMRDSLHAPVPANAANMLQTVADRIALMSGAQPGVLAHGEPEITWDSIGLSVALVWHRDGTLAWRVSPDSDSVMPVSPRVALLFGRALDSAQARHETFTPWPDSTAADSLEMWVDFRRPTVDSAGVVKPVRAHVAVPLFSVAAPREKTVRVVKPPHTHYPQRLLMTGVEGTVILQFVVDTTGRADTLTMRDLWPRDRPPLTGGLASFYKTLVATARQMAMETRFAPAEAGGCKIRQVVQQPFTWQMAR